jgi:hypothetical protein
VEDDITFLNMKRKGASNIASAAISTDKSAKYAPNERRTAAALLRRKAVSSSRSQVAGATKNNTDASIACNREQILSILNLVTGTASSCNASCGISSPSSYSTSFSHQQQQEQLINISEHHSGVYGTDNYSVNSNNNNALFPTAIVSVSSIASSLLIKSDIAQHAAAQHNHHRGANGGSLMQSNFEDASSSQYHTKQAPYQYAHHRGANNNGGSAVMDALRIEIGCTVSSSTNNGKRGINDMQPSSSLRRNSCQAGAQNKLHDNNPFKKNIFHTIVSKRLPSAAPMPCAPTLGIMIRPIPRREQRVQKTHYQRQQLNQVDYYRQLQQQQTVQLDPRQQQKVQKQQVQHQQRFQHQHQHQPQPHHRHQHHQHHQHQQRQQLLRRSSASQSLLLRNARAQAAATIQRYQQQHLQHLQHLQHQLQQQKQQKQQQRRQQQLQYVITRALS